MKNATIEEIKHRLETITDDSDPIFIQLSLDSRKGVQDLLKKRKQLREKEKQNKDKYNLMLKYEEKARLTGFKYIAGIDEVGRGPLAGPVVSAAVILPENCYISGINDSKKLSERKRKELAAVIKKEATAIGIGIVAAEDIDAMNIYEATKKSMKLSIQQLTVQPDYLLIDAMKLDTIYPEESIVKGDLHSVSIAAASIIAKVARDEMMGKYHELYPDYGFNIHKGYGTKAHLTAIDTYGPSPIHRKSFAPIKEMIRSN